MAELEDKITMGMLKKFLQGTENPLFTEAVREFNSMNLETMVTSLTEKLKNANLNGPDSDLVQSKLSQLLLVIDNFEKSVPSVSNAGDGSRNKNSRLSTSQSPSGTNYLQPLMSFGVSNDTRGAGRTGRRNDSQDRCSVNSGYDRHSVNSGRQDRRHRNSVSSVNSDFEDSRSVNSDYQGGRNQNANNQDRRSVNSARQDRRHRNSVCSVNSDHDDSRSVNSDYQSPARPGRNQNANYQEIRSANSDRSDRRSENSDRQNKGPEKLQRLLRNIGLQSQKVGCPCCFLPIDNKKQFLQHLSRCTSIQRRVPFQPNDFSSIQCVGKGLKCNVCTIYLDAYHEKEEHIISTSHGAKFYECAKTRSIPATHIIFCSSCKIYFPDTELQYMLHINSKLHSNLISQLRRSLMNMECQFALYTTGARCLCCNKEVDFSEIFQHIRVNRNCRLATAWCGVCDQILNYNQVESHLATPKHHFNGVPEMFCPFCFDGFKDISTFASHMLNECKEAAVKDDVKESSPFNFVTKDKQVLKESSSTNDVIKPFIPNNLSEANKPKSENPFSFKTKQQQIPVNDKPKSVNPFSFKTKQQQASDSDSSTPGNSITSETQQQQLPVPPKPNPTSKPSENTFLQSQQPIPETAKPMSTNHRQQTPQTAYPEKENVSSFKTNQQQISKTVIDAEKKTVIPSEVSTWQCDTEVELLVAMLNSDYNKFLSTLRRASDRALEDLKQKNENLPFSGENIKPIGSRHYKIPFPKSSLDFIVEDCFEDIHNMVTSEVSIFTGIVVQKYGNSSIIECDVTGLDGVVRFVESSDCNNHIRSIIENLVENDEIREFLLVTKWFCLVLKYPLSCHAMLMLATSYLTINSITGAENDLDSKELLKEFLLFLQKLNFTNLKVNLREVTLTVDRDRKLPTAFHSTYFVFTSENLEKFQRHIKYIFESLI